MKLTVSPFDQETKKRLLCVLGEVALETGSPLEKHVSTCDAIDSMKEDIEDEKKSRGILPRIDSLP